MNVTIGVRFGGDEFEMVLSHSIAHPDAFCEQLRQTVEGQCKSTMNKFQWLQALDLLAVTPKKVLKVFIAALTKNFTPISRHGVNWQCRSTRAKTAWYSLT